MKLTLAIEVLRKNGSVCFRAQGTSMLPTLWPGDLLTIERIERENLQVNDIVLVMRDGHPVIHRLIVGSRGAALVTRGDAMPRRDARGGEVLGRVVEVTRYGQRFAPSRSAAAANRLVGLALCYCDSLRGFLLKNHGWRCRRAQPGESLGSVQKGFLNRTA
jgi:signal peptidase I